MLSRFLTLEFASRIECKPNQAGIFALQEFIAALHQNATMYLESVYEWGSYISAKKATYDTILMLKKFLDNRKNK
jgi:hypothetical protein